MVHFNKDWVPAMGIDLTFLKKTPPHSPDAEKTVLGGILVNNKNLNVVLSIISPDDYYKDSHRKILEKIIVLVDKGLPADLLTLSEELQKTGELEDAGGTAYLSSLMDGVPKSINVEYYARIIKEKALLRRLISSSAKIISSSYSQNQDADTLLAEAQSAIIDVAEEKIKPGFVPVHDLTETALEDIDNLRSRQAAVTGIPSGFNDLDGITAGFHPSEFIVVAARPSMGKTAICLNISLHIGLNTEKKVGFFSLEMSKEQLILRLLCSDAKVDLMNVRRGFVNEREFSSLKKSAQKIADAGIFIDETPALTVMEMKAKARRLKMEQNLDAVFVDYIQLMRSGAGRFENRTQEMSFISRSLKELAKELQIPVVGISQLSRAPEKGRSKPVPQLSDLRESGAIEQDADVVMFIFREEVYKPDDEAIKGLAKVIIAKQRNGPIGNVDLAFLQKYASFHNLEAHPFEE
jgi:replicative DNA helicase